MPLRVLRESVFTIPTIPPSSELIVFNPPWIPGSVFDAFDSALYFDDDLFERFFDQAHQCLSPSGSIVILFSNIMTLLRPDIPHPIEAEGLRGRFTCTKKMKRKIKPKDSRRRTKEKAEIWELSRI
jgi:methylase of polypeptide subunit release factors